MSKIENAKNSEKDSLPIKKAEQEHKCVFCEMIGGHAPISIIRETDDSISFMSLENHVIVTPKKHIDRKDIGKKLDDLADAFKLAASLVGVTERTFEAEGINIVLNLGKAAGQDIDHLHIHLIPRNEGDKKVRLKHLDFQPREILDATAKKIRSRIFRTKVLI